MALLSLLNVSKHFGSNVILDCVNLNIEKGEKIAIIGKNGSGKSTLLRIIAGEDSKNYNFIESSIKDSNLDSINSKNHNFEFPSESSKNTNFIESKIDSSDFNTQDSKKYNKIDSKVIKNIESNDVFMQDSGERIVQNGIEILSLGQKIDFPPDKNVKEILESSLYNLQKAHTRLQEISNIPNFIDDKLLNKEYSEINDYIDRHDGWDIESKVDFITQSFNLSNFLDKKIAILSGGEQKRVALACLLIKSADIILLDEPTNHLDVEMVEFLENYLKNMRASIVFISHDRYFIDNIAERIVEIDNSKIHNFQGGYLSYLESKQLMLSNMQKESESLKKILKVEEKWLRQGISARRKRNEGRKERLMQLREKVKKMPSLLRNVSQTLEKTMSEMPKDSIKNTKKMLFELENFSLNIGEKNLIKSLNIRILQGEKLGIVGKNGGGKSSLLKFLVNLPKTSLDSNILPQNSYNTSISGNYKCGEIKIGYFDQHKKILQDSKSLIETFCPNGGDRVDVRGKNMHVFGYLKSFLFPKEDLDKKIGMLSGGEKSRVALALLFSKSYDCLILDEPTNDLDIATMNILEDYLYSSECAIIFVSHDRYFVDRLAQRLLIIESNGVESNEKSNCIITHAKYSEYLSAKSDLKEVENEILESKVEFKKEQKLENSQDSKNKVRKLSYKEKLEYENLEEEIEILESSIKVLEKRLSNPKEYEKYGIQALSKDLESAKNELDSKMERFFELSEKLDSVTP
ncbi:ATP-binding cassette domain-containing protein [Helicobacter saguini]|uniref:ABC transporter ATP-binding protein n=1 Tax=Helicobacter saguini TaxID=1548018 RepID=A0A347VNL8_9HELI|nr:ABC-F family ATP-binding cassette domain-containing protein [Helicobacter saguini]MWV61714.1 ATP-binding cassette domain-containing protein [Helicobacter saguini]MWV67614.1 ATP-binding cassette domain-containing protein [Helicobacter saguini]MWV69965.1 ATP-binding cassette domain-containing protein [Helicobacter saguini]MWV72821.1 ATP-binding cassette domain-containing protein [Helicobacter saguini]TLD92365.1 ABC transporter ATP-binding protein [Helicobacter saguini]